MNSRSLAADLFIPCLVVGVVGMMVFPLPSGFLDCLLIANIAISMLLLLSALFLAEPERFTVLPALLLVTTVFRLALNISTTRQILIYGEAPDTVTAFGSFVIGGEFIVGIVVFLIISIVQFIVIAKGAERVAEVAARFTLDAMPGRQMAIDADIRAGVITLLEARQQRLELQRESKLYGALDGAMKFIKGDAIAALLIIGVNAVAGVSIGIFSHHLSAEQAFRKYFLFTVGDGLVSQLPALLVAVAAGVTVTRVSQGGARSFSSDLLEQLGSDYRTGLIAGGFLLLLALAPGLPAMPLIACGGSLLAFGRRRQKKVGREAEDAAQPGFAPKLYGPLLIRISPAGVTSLRADGSLIRRVHAARSALFDRFGVVVPEPRFDIDAGLGGTAATLFVQGVAAGPLLSGGPAVAEELVERLVRTLEPRLLSLIDDGHTRMLLSLHRDGNEELIGSLIPTLTTVTALTAISRQLLAERISIRNFPTLLQAVADYNLQVQEGGAAAAGWPAERGGEPDSPGRSKLAATTAFVRAAMRREITQIASGGEPQITACRLAPNLDDLFSAIERTGVPLNPEIANGVVKSIQTEFAPESAGPAVIIASNYARRILGELIICSGLPVLAIAPEEIEAGVPLRISGTIGLSAEAKAEQEDDYGDNAGQAGLEEAVI